MAEEIDFQTRLAAAITDPDFEKLGLAMREPNIFRALAIERQEIRHSNFFAFLLDPAENHGLGDILLRKFLRDIFADNRAHDRTLFDADLMDFRQVDVRREWRSIDILIDFPNDVIVVENKVDSSEHSKQLSRYKGVIDGEFGAKRKHFVFLTPLGSDPADESDRKVYINYSYEQIAGILSNVLELYRDSISDKMAFYIEDYLTTINREILMDDKLNDLARKVYKAHKSAFDFVFENRPDPASVLYPYFEKELKSRGFVIGSRNKGYIRFTSSELAQRLPKTGEGWPDKEVFLFEIDYFWSDQNAVAKAVISPGNEMLRETILSVAKGLKFYRKAEIEAKVKRVIEGIAGDAAEIFSTIADAVPRAA